MGWLRYICTELYNWQTYHRSIPSSNRYTCGGWDTSVLNCIIGRLTIDLFHLLIGIHGVVEIHLYWIVWLAVRMDTGSHSGCLNPEITRRSKFNHINWRLSTILSLLNQTLWEMQCTHQNSAGKNPGNYLKLINIQLQCFATDEQNSTVQ